MKLRILLLILGAGLCACTDLLQENPENFFSEETVFSTEAGVETAVNGVYARLSQPNYYGTEWHNFLTPNSGKFYSSQNANRDGVALTVNTNNNLVARIWEGAFETINAANTVIANLEQSDLPNAGRALGDAYFLRGVAYFDLVRLFGGVPIRTEPTELDDVHLPRSERTAVIDLIVQDFNRAKELLPAPGDQQAGRPSSLVPNVYLAKLYATLAGEDNGDASRWQDAWTELQPVLASDAYELTPTFAELFEPNNENTVESLFELQFGHTGGQRNSDLIRLYTPSNSIYTAVNVRTFGRVRPNKETYDEHLATYPDDPRLDATFIAGSYPKINGGNQKIYPEKTNGNQGFAVVRKWLDPSYNGTTTSRNLILLRYADVLLLAAEVENELRGPEGAYEYVNQVLARARDVDGDGESDATEPADYTDLSQDEFRTRILRERRFELLSEGHEWFDLRRRGYDYFRTEVVEPHNTHPEFDPTTDFMYPDDPRNLLLPIPLQEISGNQEIGPEDQNPGY